MPEVTAHGTLVLRASRRRFAAAVLAALALLSACGGQPAEPKAAKVTVVDVTGLPYADARAELRDLGLDVRRSEAPGKAPQGDVVEQDVEPGTAVDRGRSVTLVVSSGPPEPVVAASEPEERTWSDVHRGVHDGVVRITADFCDGTGTGSGFLIEPNLVATNAHVVDDSTSITVDSGGESQAGSVVGIDASTDVALVRVDGSLPGHVFEAARKAPTVGSDVAALGYPLGAPLSLVTGTVSGLDRRIDGDGASVAGLLQTDAAVNPGNSGGPLIDQQGRVVGVIVSRAQYMSFAAGEPVQHDAEGVAYAIPSSTAFSLLEEWRYHEPIASTVTCRRPAPPANPSSPVTAMVEHPEVGALIGVFGAYAAGINTGDYARAYAQWSPRMQQGISFDEFAHQQSTSYLYDLTIMDVRDQAEGELAVDVNFWSEQSPEFGHEGQACSVWALTYRMVNAGGRWLIDGATPVAEGIPHICD